MRKIVPVKFGPRTTDVDIEGKKFSALPGILAALHDTEIPSNVEIYADKEPVKNLDEFIPEGVQSIEITALAGKKQKE